MNKKNPVVHFEMPYENHERLTNFYSNAFGWNMQKLGPEMGDYVLAQTADTDENNMVKTPGTINGGFSPKSEEYKTPSLVINVDSLKDSMDKVKASGGKIIGEPAMIPGIGNYVSFLDSEGNKVSMLEPVPMAQ